MICYCRLQQLGFSQFFTQCETTESDFLEANETCRQVALSANKYMLTLHEHLGSLSVFLVGSVLLIFVVFWVVLWVFFVCLRPMPTVVSFSWLSIHDCPFLCLFIWIRFTWKQLIFILCTISVILSISIMCFWTHSSNLYLIYFYLIIVSNKDAKWRKKTGISDSKHQQLNPKAKWKKKNKQRLINIWN